MNRFTPGPWESDGEIVGWRNGDVPAVAVRYKSREGDGFTQHSPVCLVTQDRGMWGAGSLNPLEDAQLISAAPDLLKELSHLVSHLEPLEKDGGLQVPGLATLNGARAAISKATAAPVDRTPTTYIKGNVISSSEQSP